MRADSRLPIVETGISPSPGVMGKEAHRALAGFGVRYRRRPTRIDSLLPCRLGEHAPVTRKRRAGKIRIDARRPFLDEGIPTHRPIDSGKAVLEALSIRLGHALFRFFRPNPIKNGHVIGSDALGLGTLTLVNHLEAGFYRPLGSRREHRTLAGHAKRLRVGSIEMHAIGRSHRCGSEAERIRAHATACRIGGRDAKADSAHDGDNKNAGNDVERHSAGSTFGLLPTHISNVLNAATRRRRADNFTLATR